MKKKTLFILLSALLWFTPILSAAFAEIPESVSVSNGSEQMFTCEDYEYNLLEDGTAEITKYTGNEEVLVVPDELDGYRVTVIGDNAFYSCQTLTGVIIPDSVASIGIAAFCSCENLTWITLPDSVISIGSGAFGNCNSLTAITLPDRLTSIEDYIFFGCISLNSINLPNSVKSIGYCAFSFCTHLDVITLPGSLTAIDDWAFWACNRLSEITLPDSLTKIGECAFNSCICLDKIFIPENVTNIGNYAFSDCGSITLIVYEGSYAEEYCAQNDLNYQYFPYETTSEEGDAETDYFRMRSRKLASERYPEIDLSQHKEDVSIMESKLFNKRYVMVSYLSSIFECGEGGPMFFYDAETKELISSGLQY